MCDSDGSLEKNALMKVDIMTLFPDTVNAVLHESILGRAVKKGILDICCVQIRDFTENRQKQVDDYPYGGGWGCVMMAQPLKSCLEHVMSTTKQDYPEREFRSRVIYMSPQGEPFTQAAARRLKENYDHLVLVCGHYEGIDERFIEECVDEEISIGDFVLTGGEIAAMAVTDCVCRMIPGVLADEECYTGESHWDGLLEYPQYTRPEDWEGRKVPEILINGDHAKIEKWRKKQQLIRTKAKRPDMYAKLDLSGKEQQELVREIEYEASRLKLTEPLSYRKASPEDMGSILAVVSDARAILKKRHVDQWQGDYPQAENFLTDIARGECYLVLHGEEPAGFFTLSVAHEESYEHLTDGKWDPDAECCVLHRAAVAKKYRGSGIAKFLFSCVDDACRAAGRSCIRTDTHRKNKAMRNLMCESGYEFKGNLIIDSEPGHDPARQAFEKKLK